MSWEIQVTQGFLTTVGELDRFRGRWAADPGLPPARLARLAEASRIRSVAASCRLAGLRLTDHEVAGLLQGNALPVGAVKEVLGYAAALTCPLPPSDQLLTADHLGRLHALLTGAEPGTARPSPWRTRDSYREAFGADGKATGRVFCTLPPHLIEQEVDRLVTWLEFELRAGERHPILVIGVFVAGLLAASPYEHSNGRFARALISRLLERAGYTYLPYASVESQIEDLRERYYDAFDQAQTRFWKGEGNLEPWLSFFLEVLSRHRQRVEAKVALERETLEYPPLQRTILDTVREHGTVDAGLLLRATGANRNTLKDNLRRLVDLGALEKTGQRRGTRYRLASGEPLRRRES